MTATLFESMEDAAINILRDTCPPEGFYFADSGGKDSCVCLHLLKKAGVKFDSHHHLTTVDAPEIVRFIRHAHKETIIERPKKTMWQLIVENGIPPTRMIRYCCRELKEHGGNGRIIVTGVRAKESSRRAKRKQIEFCHNSRSRYVHPIFRWSDSDVWSYITGEKIEYCGLYDEGHTRIGCIGCPMAPVSKRLADFERWPKHRDAYIRAFQRMLAGRTEKGLESDWDTAEDVMTWWVHGKERLQKTDPNQSRLFFEDGTDEALAGGEVSYSTDGIITAHLDGNDWHAAMAHVGKKYAGRTLDGQTHDALAGGEEA